MKSKKTVATVLAVVNFGLTSAQSQTVTNDAPAKQGETEDAKKNTGKGFLIRPVLLDSKNSSGATVGIQYEINRSGEKILDRKDSGTPDINANVLLSEITYEIKGSGTITGSKDRNPNKMLDIGGSLYYLLPIGIAKIGIGGTVKYETDQEFDNKQFAYGISTLAVKSDALFPNDTAIVNLGFRRVDPKEDKDRTALLKNGPLSNFYRWDLEFYYLYPLKGSFKSIEFQYRHFQEVNAPSVIEAGKYDRHRLGTIRFNIKNDLFVAYSKGSLPFDVKSDRAVTIGWTAKFE